MEIKEVKREIKNITMTIRTSKPKSDWMKKHQISPTLLFDKAFALISVNEFDITADVIKKLDVSLPKVKLELKPVPRPAAGAPGAPQAAAKK